jgi:hypothetical protein
MGSRLAYTGGMAIVAADGGRRRVPAGACWIDRQFETPGVCTIRWTEQTIEYSVQLSSQELRSYVLGCIVQYA